MAQSYNNNNNNNNNNNINNITLVKCKHIHLTSRRSRCDKRKTMNKNKIFKLNCVVVGNYHEVGFEGSFKGVEGGNRANVVRKAVPKTRGSNTERSISPGAIRSPFSRKMLTC